MIIKAYQHLPPKKRNVTKTTTADDDKRASEGECDRGTEKGPARPPSSIQNITPGEHAHTKSAPHPHHTIREWLPLTRCGKNNNSRRVADDHDDTATTKTTTADDDKRASEGECDRGTEKGPARAASSIQNSMIVGLLSVVRQILSRSSIGYICCGFCTYKL